MRLLLSVLGATLLAVAAASAQGTAPATQEQLDALLSEADRLASQQVRRADAAVVEYRKAIAAAERRGDEARTARGFAGLGTALWSLNQMSASARALERAAMLARRTGQGDVEVESLRMLGVLSLDRGRYDEGDRLLEEAMRAASRTADRDKPASLVLRIRTFNTSSVSARRQGRLALARERGLAAQQLLDEALRRRVPVPDVLLFQVPFNIGKSLSDAGEYAPALGYFDRAFQAAERSGMKGGQWHALHDTGEWYLAQADVERAARYHERALALSRTMDSRDMETQSLRANGTIAEARGDVAAALAFYSSAVTMMRRIGQFWTVPSTLVTIARVRWRAGDLAGAEQAAAEALAAAAKAGVGPGLAQAHLEIGRQALARESPGEAEAAYRGALRVARDSGITPLAAAALAGLGHVARRRGDLDAAVAHYRDSALAIGTLRGHVPSLELRASFAEAVHDTYSSLIDVLLELHRLRSAGGYGEAAFLTVEQERSQNLVEALNGLEVDRSRELPPSDRDRQRQLQSTVAALQTRLLSEFAQADRAGILARLDDAERALAALEARARREGFAGAWYPAGGLNALRSILAEDEALVALAETDGGHVAFLVLRDGLEIVPLPHAGALPRRIEFFSRLLRAGHAPDAVALGRGLTSELLAPVLERLPGTVRRLLFAVAGPLAAVPFAALPVPRRAAPDGFEPLLAQYEVGYVPSLAALHHLRRRAPAESGGDLLAFGDPRLSVGPGVLRYSDDEVRAIAALAGPETTIFLGARASESALKTSGAANYRALHFATHALVDGARPSRSALLLAASEAEDGLLQPAEIYALTLTSELVVLSACRSAAGRASAAEGMLSLARAFMYAGARSVVGSQWDVDDRSSARLMARFYGALSQRKSVAAALRAAQISLAGPDPYATAAQWAGFVVSGDPHADPAFQGTAQPRPVRLAGTLAATAAGLLGLLASFRTRRRMA